MLHSNYSKCENEQNIVLSEYWYNQFQALQIKYDRFLNAPLFKGMLV